MTDIGTQYADDRNLAARQRLWQTVRREEPFELFPWVLDLCELHGDERILDLGCGNQGYEAALRARSHRGQVVALDLSHGMRPAVQADAQALPFPDDRFDVVLAPHMLYHVPDIGLAAREARRVPRPGGTFVAVTNGERSLPELFALVEEAAGPGLTLRGRFAQRSSLENGPQQLAAAFEHIDVRSHAAVVTIDDVEVVAGYVGSVADLYATATVPRGAVVDRVRADVATIIERDGALRLTTSGGAIVCR